MKNKIIGGLVVIALAVGAFFVGKAATGDDSDASSGPVVIQRAVERTTLQEVRTLQGELLREELQILNSPVDGRVSEVFVEDGDTIEAGQTIFALDGRAAVAANGAFAFFRQLDVGSDGPDVEQLERILSEAGYDVGSVDRLFTEDTRRGLARWQVDHGYGGATPEPGETVQVSLQQNQEGYTIGARNTVAVRIEPSVPEIAPAPAGANANRTSVAARTVRQTTPLVEVSADVTQVAEGGLVTFTFTVTSPFAGNTIVEIAFDGEATEEDDYDDVPDSVTFPAGASSVTLVVQTLDDDVLETADEDLVVSIADQFGDNVVYSAGGLSLATVAILADGVDERPVIEIDSDEPIVAEGGGGGGGAAGGGGGGGDITMTLTSSLELNEDIEIWYEVSGTTTLGEDYEDPDEDTEGQRGFVELPSGDTTVDITVNVRDDDLVEFDEDVTVRLLANPEDVAGDPSYYVALFPNQATTIIESDDIPELTLRGGGNVGEGAATSVVVVADQAPVEDTSVNYQFSGSAEAGDDFEDLAGTVILRAGQTQVSIAIRTLDDDVVFLPSDIIVADWPARVGTVEVDEGEFMLQGEPILELTEPVFTIKLFAAATDFSVLEVGQIVTIELSAGDQEAEGVITELDSAATVDDAGAERYEGIVESTSEELIAVDGAIVTIEVIVNEAVDVFAVPISAVSQDATGNKEVRILTDAGTIERVSVETGLEDGALIEITSGLDGTEIVIVEIDPA